MSLCKRFLFFVVPIYVFILAALVMALVDNLVNQ